MKLLLSPIVVLLCCFLVHGQTNQNNSLLTRKVKISVVTSDIHNVLSDLAAHYKIPIGFESAAPNDHASGPKININLEEGTVQEVLDLIVQVDSRYKWELVDGVINLRPISGGEAFLDVLVNDFSIQPEESRLDIRKAITDIPEVRASLEREGIRPMHVALSSADIREVSPNFSLHLSQVTVRTILNRIILDSNSHYWVVSRFGKQRELLIVNF